MGEHDIGHDTGHDIGKGWPTRRQLLAAAGASVLTLTGGTGATEQTVLAGGFVYEDRGRRGRRAPGDPGIAGVMVSNGRDVVTTEADGRWRLPIAEGGSLFVVKPPHWSTPLGPGGVPRFSRLHQPHGSPREVAYRHAGVAPTGPLPQSIDFGLTRAPEGAAFEALLLADTQPESDLELGYLRDDIVTGALTSAAAFGINHGDVVFDDLALYPRYLQIMGATGIPWHHCPGNHDMNTEAPDDASSRETWKRVFGPRHYAFQHGGATFIVLDNVHYFGHRPGMPLSGLYCGLIGEIQLAFVRNVLANVPREQLVVVSMHIPLATYQDPGNPADNTADRNAFLRLLAGRPHSVSFAGHMHLSEHHYLAADGDAGAYGAHHHQVLGAASGGWWSGPRDGRGIPSADAQDGAPNGYHVLTVDGAHYATRFVPAAGKAVGRIRACIVGPRTRSTDAASADPADAVVDGPVAVDALGACELVVNVFDGGPKTVIAYEIAGQQAGATPMRRVAANDPYVAQLFARHAAAQKPWVRAVPSSHVWKAPLPTDLAPGAYRLSVQGRDEYGQVLTAHIVLEVAPSRSAAGGATTRA